MKREKLLLKLLILAVCWMLVTYELGEGLSLPNFLLVFLLHGKVYESERSEA